jgi:soluble lytic murein transglycosylase-like protein
MRLSFVTCFTFIAISAVVAHAEPAVETMVRRTAERFGVPKELAVNVARVETGNSCGKVGAHGERGPLQIKPSSAAGLGYKNIKNASCQRQLDAGMAHLLMCYKAARRDWYRTAACHNGGPGVLKRGHVRSSVRRYVKMVLR